MDSMTILNAVMAILTSGTATAYLTEFLKLSFIKVPAERYPRATAAVLSVLTSLAALLLQGVAFTKSLSSLLGVGAGTFVISGVLYQIAIKGLKDSNAK